MTAQTLKEEFREADIIARMGGEEYCVVAFDMNPNDVEDVFNRARIALSRKSVQIEGETVQVTTSIGVCNTREDGFEKMISLADKALYDAKEGGRNQVSIGAASRLFPLLHRRANPKPPFPKKGTNT